MFQTNEIHVLDLGIYVFGLGMNVGMPAQFRPVIWLQFYKIQIGWIATFVLTILTDDHSLVNGTLTWC